MAEEKSRRKRRGMFRVMIAKRWGGCRRYYYFFFFGFNEKCKESNLSVVYILRDYFAW